MVSIAGWKSLSVLEGNGGKPIATVLLGKTGGIEVSVFLVYSMNLRTKMKMTVCWM